jgi:hypothetical protein
MCRNSSCDLKAVLAGGGRAVPAACRSHMLSVFFRMNHAPSPVSPMPQVARGDQLMRGCGHVHRRPWHLQRHWLRDCICRVSEAS